MPEVAVGKYGKIYMPSIETPPIKQVTPDCVTCAVRALNDYKYWGLITKEERKEVKNLIRSAKTNNEISNIMSRVRHRIYD